MYPSAAALACFFFPSAVQVLKRSNVSGGWLNQMGLLRLLLSVLRSLNLLQMANALSLVAIGNLATNSASGRSARLSLSFSLRLLVMQNLIRCCLSEGEYIK